MCRIEEACFVISPRPIATCLGLLLLLGLAQAGATPTPTQAAAPPPKPESTADHSKFKELQGPFVSGPEVTQACLGCHTEAAKQVHKSIHWTWELNNPDTGQRLGKKHLVNSYCISITSNYARCTSCHVGYGWKDGSFDFGSEQNVDCLACHDTTGSYKKFPTGAGHPAYQDTEFAGKPVKAVDLVQVAQHVGRTSRATCGACHFSGGGGDAVKHGDLDSSLGKPDLALDVHMNAEGLNYSCATCHTFINHQSTGSRYTVTAKDETGVAMPGVKVTRATCESCHGNAPHRADINNRLNTHVDKVACQTCHIPAMARGGKATKTWWDWSTAGQKGEDGKPLVKKDEKGNVTYDGMKGDFAWGEDLIPEYFWFDGQVRYSLLGDKIDDSIGVAEINSVRGSYGDPKARIWPFKVMRGRQPYDTENKTLLVGHLFGKDDAAYWKTFDWDKALRAGMQEAKAVGQTGGDYSGKYAFIETKMYWPLTHMVAPKEEALDCESCHSHDGRLAKLTGFYLPGRDANTWIDRIGWFLVIVTLAGVLLHGLARLFIRRRSA
jgi:octaheme c-type cytochrome (tetrathionate reductase family)